MRELGGVKTPGRYDRAELLVALWVLGAPPNEKLPTSHGILDRALQKVKDLLPAELASLTFGPEVFGPRCHELPDILCAARELLLTNGSSPAYLITFPYLAASVRLPHEEAEEIVLDHGMDIDDATRIGGALFTEAARLESEFMGQVA